MAKATKLKSGNWRVLAYVGKDVTKSGYKSFTAPTKKEAERLASAFVPQAPQDKKESVTVGDAIDNYIASKSAVLSPATIRGYERIRRTDMQDIMGVNVFELTQDAVQKSFNGAAKTKSPKTLRNAHGLLVASLKTVRPDFILHTTLPQKEKPKMQIPTQAEIDTLVAAADQDMRLAISLAAMLGLRRSEICGLTFADFDAENKTLTIRRAMVADKDAEWTIKPPKSFSGYRTLTIPATLFQTLVELDGEAKDPLCKINPNMITNRFEALQRLCFGRVLYRFHDLRHYNASVMLRLGVPNKYAMERMGHATDAMLKAVYQHTMKDKQKEIADQLNAFFEGNTT